MELPDLGKQCDMKSCRQLDFLPVKCNRCKGTFCKDHYSYEKHGCPMAIRKNTSIPTSNRKRKRVYIHKCSKEGCNRKEMVEFACDKCQLNHCLKHRHPLDHACKHNVQKSKIIISTAQKVS